LYANAGINKEIEPKPWEKGTKQRSINFFNYLSFTK